MTFLLTEQSASSGRPIEAYRFTQLLNGSPSTTYCYTTSHEDIILGGVTYKAIPLSRSELKVGTQNDDQLEVTIDLPVTTEVVQIYAFNLALPDLVLEVFRFHLGLNPSSDYELIWKGPVNQFEIVENICTIHSPNIFSKVLQTQYPQTNYQTQCNNILYGPVCKAVESSYTYTSTVEAVDDAYITILDSHSVDNYLGGGRLTVNRTGESRLMGNNIGPLLQVNFRFSDIEVGDTVTFTAGCDHTYATCISKFSNGLNYGGFPYIPVDNPFVGQLANPVPPANAMSWIMQMLIELGVGILLYILTKFLEDKFSNLLTFKPIWAP